LSAIPFLRPGDAEGVVARRGAEAITLPQFLADVARVAAALPTAGYVVNLCADRYRFAAGLCAALLREQVSLLPPGTAPELLRQLARDYPGVYAMSDAEQPDCPLPLCRVDALPPARRALEAVPSFPADRIAVIAFTSGSTGRPMPHAKRWGSLCHSTRAEAGDLGLSHSGSVAVLATVPAQHMYGLETSVLMPLQSGFALCAARPFYPADIRGALEQMPAQRVLVTTPVHLRALLAEEQRLPALRLIVCATAPLPSALAAEAEQRYAAPLMEIYGFTEAGQVAWRRTMDGPTWHTLTGLHVRVDAQGAWFGGSMLGQELLANDVIEAQDERRFTLHGRNADLVNIGGKRTSLAYLTQQLLSVEGVRDAAFFAPDSTGDGAGVTRLTAFAVAPGLERQAILAALRERVDPVFLPRPLHMVDALPRNATGKLPREALAALARAFAPARREGPG
jgi:acyl-coenzyme A synthetase/AMP-(fatty) acid ligase